MYDLAQDVRELASKNCCHDMSNDDLSDVNSPRTVCVANDGIVATRPSLATRLRFWKGLGKVAPAPTSDTGAIAQPRLVFVRQSEREIEEERRAEITREIPTGNGPGVATRVTSEQFVVRERVIEGVEIPPAGPDGQVNVKHVTIVEQRVFMRIVETLYLSIESTPVGVKVPEVEPTCGEKCVDLTCQTCVCSFKSPFGGQVKESLPEARNIMKNPILQRARAKGWAILRGMTLPFVSDIARDVWIVLELIAVLLAFAFSVTSFTLGKKEVFNAIHLGLTILSTVLAVIDAVVNLWQFRSCKRCRASCGISARQNEEEESEAQEPQQSSECMGRCRKCIDLSKSVSDFIRMLLTELILYPLLICDIFDLATEEGYKPGTSATDIIGFILFLISSFSLLFYVYILRLVVLIYMIKTVQRHRKQIISRDEGQYDFASSCDTGFRYQIHFFIHVFTQMVVQVLMLIAIGAKIEYENRGDHDSIRVSNHLWYMLIAGYVLPVCGLLTFFLITYYWTQEFPVGVCVDLISILEAPDYNHIFSPGESMDASIRKLEELSKFVYEAELKQEFRDMHYEEWYRKFFYPMHSPVMIILCIVYTAFQLAFIVCATYAVDPETNEMTRVVLSDGLGWTVYYGITVGICILFNLYVFVIAGFWSFVVGALIAGLVSALLMAIICAPCALCGCGGGDSRDQNRS